MHWHRMLRTGAAGAAVMCSICCASAAESTAAAMARVVSVPAVDASEPSIRFGSFAATTGPQRVTIHPDGGRTVRGISPEDVRPSHRFGPAGLMVNGERGLTFSVTLPASASLEAIGSGFSPRGVLHVTDFRLAPSNDGELKTGARILLLGATVSIPRNPGTGMYSGNAILSVAYD